MHIRLLSFEGWILDCVNTVNLSSAKPSPAGQIRRERIWSRGDRPQGYGQDSPETLGWVRGNQHRKNLFLSPHSSLLPMGEGAHNLQSIVLSDNVTQHIEAIKTGLQKAIARSGTFCVLGLILLAFSQFASAAAKIEHWQTPQGSRVYYVHTEGLPMVDIQVVFDAGSARDGQQFGLAALTADLLDTGAGQWNADEIAQRFESVGAQFGVSSSIDMATVSLRTLTDKPLFDKAIETMQVILTKPVFNEADFQREKNRTLAGLKQQEESPAELASIAFYNTLYGNHPYAHPASGVIKTVADLKSADLRHFYQKFYVAANAIVVIVGDLTKQQAEQTALKLVAGLPAGKKPEVLADVDMPLKSTQQHIEFPSTQTHVLVGLPGTYRKDPDYFDLYAGNHILGGSGLVSKLFDEVREKRGLAYSASSYFIPMLKPGPFMVSLQTRNDQTTQALQVLNQTLADFIDKGPTEAELVAAKKNITGGFAMRFDTNKELAGYVAMIGFYDMPLDYLDTFQQKIEQVTVASITDAFKRRVNPQLLQTITVGKSAEKSAK